MGDVRKSEVYMKYAELNDESLVMLTLSGEAAAYEVLVVRYQKAVLAAAQTVTHSAYLAEDAAQDAFVTAWMKLDTLAEPSKYRGWVCRIAGNCARRMMEQYRVYVDFDALEDCLPDTDPDADPALAYARREEHDALHAGIDRLPERVKLIIRLHYFEGKTVGEIAERLGVSIGTVKAQLYDGRKKLRKDLDAMDQTRNDTLTERVMKKVEELKKWKYKREKTGFETVYRDVLAEVEALPDSRDKSHALADVLVRGWWWMGEQSDAMLDRIKEAALAGKNEDVMSFVVLRESKKIGGMDNNQWLRGTAIPELQSSGFKTAVGSTWLQIARNLIYDEKGFNANRQEILQAAEEARAWLPEASVDACLSSLLGQAFDRTDAYVGLTANKYGVQPHVVELRTEDGEVMYWDEQSILFGDIEAYDWKSCYLLYNAAGYDGHFTLPGLGAGENSRERLYHLRDGETVDTPAGRFDGCEVWACREAFTHCVTYWKEGVGIVRQDYTRDGYTTVTVLSAYSVKGAGLLPLAVGNEWRYAMCNPDSSVRAEITYAVTTAADGTYLLSGFTDVSGADYCRDCWEDMMQAVANEYYNYENGEERYADVSSYLERAEELAVTPAQKAHTRAAASVARRIMAGEASLTPGTDTENRWNFFNRNLLSRRNGRLNLSEYNSLWSFEIKIWDDSVQSRVLLDNFIYDILHENAGTLWNDAWTDGYTEIVRRSEWGNVLTTEITCAACGTVTVPAGRFDDCLKVTLHTSGHGSGVEYRNGEQVFIFAPGVGLVSFEAEIPDTSRKAVYLLTKYEGTGDGYFPLGEGFVRRYEAQDLTDGYVGWTEYTTVKAARNDLFGDEETYLLFSDQCGIRKMPRGITLYDSVDAEREERRLYNENRYPEAQALGRLNDLRILFHTIFRFRDMRGDGRIAATHMGVLADMAKAWGGGVVPDALVGWYARRLLLCGAAWMGCEEFEKGFACLDESMAAYRKWASFAEGALLSVGNGIEYKDFRMVKDKPVLILPDGTREVIPEASEWTLNGGGKGMPYYAMTHTDNWAWFTPVVHHPVYGARFAEYIEKAKKLAEE